MIEENDLITNDLITYVLKKNKLDYLNYGLKKYKSGQRNLVFLINNKFVLKLAYTNEIDLEVFRKHFSISKLLISHSVKSPFVIDFGFVGGRNYLLMNKLSGRDLLVDWHLFNDVEKEENICLIARQLRNIHTIHSDKYSFNIGHRFDNFCDALDNLVSFRLIDESKLTKKYMLDDLNFLKRYYDRYKRCCDEIGLAVLVHNDFHFGNILYDTREITGILDFDRCCYASKDYELAKIIHFIFFPWIYFPIRKKSLYSNIMLIKELKWFKKYYPELFCHKYCIERIRIFFVFIFLRTISKFCKGQYAENEMKLISKQIELIYGSDLLENAIIC